jgi:hypothetical protein
LTEHVVRNILQAPIGCRNLRSWGKEGYLRIGEREGRKESYEKLRAWILKTSF